jgi:hypothetical protein
MVTTARTIVFDALLDIQVASNEEPMQAPMAEQGLRLLNNLLDSWSLERLTIYYTPPTLLPWPAGTQQLTWGPGGAIATARPIAIAPSAQYRDVTGLELPLAVMTHQEEYAALTLKQQQASTLQVLYYAPSMPTGTLFGWPVPTQSWDVVVYPWQVLGRFVSLDDEILFPPGYERALRVGLALEAAASYGVQPSPMLGAILNESKASLKRTNQRIPVLGLDPALAGAGARDPYAIYTGIV